MSCCAPISKLAWVRLGQLDIPLLSLVRAAQNNSAVAAERPNILPYTMMTRYPMDGSHLRIDRMLKHGALKVYDVRCMH